MAKQNPGRVVNVVLYYPLYLKSKYIFGIRLKFILSYVLVSLNVRVYDIAD